MRYLFFSLLVSVGLFLGLAFDALPAPDLGDDPPELTVPEGFTAEILYHPTAEDSSSWVSLAMDPRGRLLASDQYGSLYRIQPAALGSDPATTRVEKLDIALGHAQGLLWAFNSLYVVVNSEEGVDGRGSGLYRVLDTDGDDQFDTINTLARFEGFGEHGPHSVILGPDGSSLYLVAGNHTELPEFSQSLVPRVWQEDQVLPAIRDPRGHASDRMAPGGWIARTDSVASSWELVSAGFRNTFDIAFNEAGDLFAFDSDMEWDLGMPWYRPIRVLHVSSGSEFGWRTGSGKWPAYYPDNLPGIVDIGQGSPTGIVSGANAAFPDRYRKGLFVFDWSFGTIYWVGLSPQGSSYRGEAEEFLSGVPLPLTDGLIGRDGALYFATGGRELDSYLVRVSYTGGDGVSPTSPPINLNPQHALRRSLEVFHGRQDAEAVRVAWPHLSHEDRFVRYAARLAVEHQPVSTWQDRVFAERDPLRRLHGVIALTRHGDSTHRGRAYEALLGIDQGSLSVPQQLDLLRAYGLAIIRLGAPTDDLREEIIASIDQRFPDTDEALNRERGRLLAALEAPGIVGKMLGLLAVYGERADDDGLLSDSIIVRSEQYGPTLTEMRANMPQAKEIDLVLSLRQVRTGWTLAQRETYFQWFFDALRKSGGESYVGFLENIRADALERVPQADRDALAELTDAYSVQALNFATLPQPEGPGRNWNRKELGLLMQDELAKPRNLEVGKRMYTAALCQACHAMGGVGGAIGPDLTQVGTRFSRGNILEAIDSPSYAISDQYAAELLTMTDGKTHIGRVVGEEDDVLLLNQNPYSPDQQIRVAKADIGHREASPVSIMPPRLLDRLNGQEVMDLMAFLLSGGDPEHRCYTKEGGCLSPKDD
ncbi:MAG: putative heme-binding domain-containing protein [Rhodothermales bacterium]|jgi:putative heme-binding domain-containing protein